MEGDWDPEKQLNICILDYMIRKNMITSAENFIREANLHNVTPEDVVLRSPEGFLLEWWSINWDSLASRISLPPPATENAVANQQQRFSASSPQQSQQDSTTDLPGQTISGSESAPILIDDDSEKKD